MPAVLDVWADRPFLGFSPHSSLPIFGTPEDTVGVVGPPRCGKSSGILIPNILLWGGPAVATSTRADLVEKTADRRQQLAEATGGKVWVYDPTESNPNFPSMRWSPLAGCKDPSICNQRVSAMAAAASKGSQDEDYWRSNTARILRPLFYAAALQDLPLSELMRWLDNETLAKEAVATLRAEPSTIAQQWAAGLDAILDSDSKTRDPMFATARSTLEAASDPVVLESCSRTDLNLQEFLLTGSTLYIIGPSHRQKVIAPLIAGLVDSIAHAASDLSARNEGGRLQFPLLLALDEVANIAPLDSLPALVSEGGGRGIITVWAAQNLAQIRDRYQAEKAKNIMASTGAKIVFGGLTVGEDLQEISSWAGEHDVERKGVARTPTGFLTSTTTVSTHLERLPVLSVGELQQLPGGFAALFYRSHPLEMLHMIPATEQIAMWAPLLGSRRYVEMQSRNQAPPAPVPSPTSPEDQPPEDRRRQPDPRPEQPHPAADPVKGFIPAPGYQSGREPQREQPGPMRAEFMPAKPQPTAEPYRQSKTGFAPKEPPGSGPKGGTEPLKAEFIPAKKKTPPPEDRDT